MPAIPRAKSHPEGLGAEVASQWQALADRVSPDGPRAPSKANSGSTLAVEAGEAMVPLTARTRSVVSSASASSIPVDLAWSSGELTRAVADSSDRMFRDAVTGLLDGVGVDGEVCKAEAAESIARLCFRSCEDREANQYRAITSGIAPPLVAMLQGFAREGGAPAAASAARALSQMCEKCPLGAMVVAQSGAIEEGHHIVRSLRNSAPHRRAKEECWRLLHNVADANAVTHERMCDAGIVSDALTLLAQAPRERTVRELLISFLCALSYNDNNRARLEPAVPLLVAELHGGGGGGGGGAAAAAAGCPSPRALASAASAAERAGAERCAGGAAPTARSTAAEVHATIALANLIGPSEADTDGGFPLGSPTPSESGSTASERAELLVGTARMERLVRILQSSTAGRKDLRSQLHLEIWKCAAAIAHLAVADPNKARLRKVGAPAALVSALRRCLEQHDALGQERCAEALWNLAFDAENRALLTGRAGAAAGGDGAAGGALAALRACAAEGSSEQARDKAKGALFVLAGEIGDSLAALDVLANGRAVRAGGGGGGGGGGDGGGGGASGGGIRRRASDGGGGAGWAPLVPASPAKPLALGPPEYTATWPPPHRARGGAACADSSDPLACGPARARAAAAGRRLGRPRAASDDGSALGAPLVAAGAEAEASEPGGAAGRRAAAECVELAGAAEQGPCRALVPRACGSLTPDAARAPARGARAPPGAHKGAHVMISYCHAQKGQVGRIRDQLLAAGYATWIDERDMRGSCLEAMARAVEEAAVVLVCVSREYKESQACRTEAEYAYKLRRDVVPLMLCDAWVPDGWLGAMLGTKLWFNFSPRARGQEATELLKLVAELGPRGLEASQRTRRLMPSAGGTAGGGGAGRAGRAAAAREAGAVAAPPPPAALELAAEARAELGAGSAAQSGARTSPAPRSAVSRALLFAADSAARAAPDRIGEAGAPPARAAAGAPPRPEARPAPTRPGAAPPAASRAADVPTHSSAPSHAALPAPPPGPAPARALSWDADAVCHWLQSAARLSAEQTELIARHALDGEGLAHVARLDDGAKNAILRDDFQLVRVGDRLRLWRAIDALFAGEGTSSSGDVADCLSAD